MQEKAYRETGKADRNTGRPGKDTDRWIGMVIIIQGGSKGDPFGFICLCNIFFLLVISFNFTTFFLGLLTV